MTSSKKAKRPFVYLCTGMSLDGKISNSKRVCTNISADDDRNFLFDHRVPCDAVMVGGRTVILDDSGLTVKSAKRRKQRLALGKTEEPAKVAIVSDISKLKEDGDFMTKGSGRKIIFTTRRSPKSKIGRLRKDADIFVFGEKRVSLKRAMAKLYDLGIKSVMVEGGGELIFSLLKDGLVDEINLKVGDLIIGGREAPTICDGEGFSGPAAKQVRLVDLKRKGSQLLLKYKVLKVGP